MLGELTCLSLPQMEACTVLFDRVRSPNVDLAVLTRPPLPSGPCACELCDKQLPPCVLSAEHRSIWLISAC